MCQNPRMAKYDNMADVYARNRHPSPTILEHLRTRGEIRPSSSVLEVGCGTGNYIGALADGCQACGLDVSREMLKFARQRAENVDFIYSDAGDLKVGDRRFDLIYSVDAIHHIERRADYFRRAAALLHPGGRLATLTHNHAMWRESNTLTRFFPETLAPMLAQYPDEDVLRGLLADAGFRNIETEVLTTPYVIDSVQPYEDKAFSALHLISEEVLNAGIERARQALTNGPITVDGKYLAIWARR